MAIVTDAVLAWLALSVTFQLARLDPDQLHTVVLWGVSAAALLALPVFAYFGLYRAIFRHAGWNSMMSLVKASSLYALLFTGVLSLPQLAELPAALGVMQPALFFVMAMFARMVVRVWFGDQHAHAVAERAMPNVLIYGAGSAGRQLAVALARSHEHHVIGFLDDDERLHNNRLDGRLIYSPADLQSLIPTLEVSDILLAMPSVSRQRQMEILEFLRGFPVHIQMLPAMSDLVSGRVGYNDLREVEIEDLLGREPVIPNGILMNKNIRGRTVLVTGAGGSIGGELCRQILTCAPERLLLVDHSESALYEIHKALLDVLSKQTGTRVPDVIPLIASVLNERYMTEIMQTWRPHTVYHAAAYKHVPMVEYNPLQGISNNVGGTLACARAAIEAKVPNFVLISSDKAVRPTNVMGASKRLSEMILQALADELNDPHAMDKPSTCFCMVRFGNVLGSAGSVVPLFKEQIQKGGPITLTHPEITRYFMTMTEAAQLVIQAGAMASPGDVFVLDMGQPVKIIDLARRMVELSGLTVRDSGNPKGDIEISMIGLRPGEKLYEELLIGGNPMKTQHPRIMKAEEEFYPWPVLLAELEYMFDLVEQGDVAQCQTLMRKLVHGYQPTSDQVDFMTVWKTETA